MDKTYSWFPSSLLCWVGADFMQCALSLPVILQGIWSYSVPFFLSVIWIKLTYSCCSIFYAPSVRSPCNSRHHFALLSGPILWLYPVFLSQNIMDITYSFFSASCAPPGRCCLRAACVVAARGTCARGSSAPTARSPWAHWWAARSLIAVPLSCSMCCSCCSEHWSN